MNGKQGCGKVKAVCCAAVVLLFGGLASVCIAADPAGYYGRWVIRKVVTSAPISAYSTAQERLFLGKRLYFSKGRARYDGKPAIRPYYDVHSVSQGDFQSDFRIRLEEIGIHNQSVTEVDVYTDNKLQDMWYSPGGMLFIKGPDSLIIYEGGVFFELVRKQ